LEVSKTDDNSSLERLTVVADRKVRDVIEAQQAHVLVEEKLKVLATYGDDVYNDSDVIRFRKCFVEGGDSYTYVAIKAGGRWYTTGRTGPYRATWTELTLWMVSGIPVTAIAPLEESPRARVYPTPSSRPTPRGYPTPTSTPTPRGSANTAFNVGFVDIRGRSYPLPHAEEDGVMGDTMNTLKVIAQTRSFTAKGIDQSRIDILRDLARELIDEILHEAGDRPIRTGPTIEIRAEIIVEDGVMGETAIKGEDPDFLLL
jgi:hypothetical protein